MLNRFKSPSGRPYSLYALLLSLGTHLYLLSVFGLNEGRVFPSTTDLGHPGVLSVQLVSLDRHNSGYAAGADTESGGTHKSTELASKPKEMALSFPQPPETLPWLYFPVNVQTEPQYYRASELTQKPVFSEGVPDNLYLTVQGDASQLAVLRLFINEHGEVDRVLVDSSDLSIEVERLLVDAFSRSKFQPGKIGQTAVKSQLKIETVLESVVHGTSRN